LISVETHGPVAIVTMAHGKANVLDTTLCRDLVAQFGQLAGGGHRAAVLTGQGPIFSAGVDLLRVRDGGGGYIQEFLPALSDAFLAVFDCSLPVVAAVNGHAVAGGCILVSACDHRVMNDSRGRIGVTELLVGVPFPITALEILRFAVGTPRLRELTSFGRTYPAAQALDLGLIDEAADETVVLPRAIAVAEDLAARPADALRHTRLQVRGPALDRIAHGRATDDLAGRMWDSAAAREKIKEYVWATLRK
jgi:enoyl-CoA hydratase